MTARVGAVLSALGMTFALLLPHPVTAMIACGLRRCSLRIRLRHFLSACSVTEQLLITQMSASAVGATASEGEVLVGGLEADGVERRERVRLLQACRQP